LRINVVIPITGLSDKAIQERLEYIRGIADPGTEIEAYQVEEGPAAIESQVDGLMAAPQILKLVKRAEAEAFDATIIWCGGDPALEAARELVNIPVIGPGESMKLLASMLGKKTCRVTPEIPVLEMRRDLDATKRMIRSIVEEKIEKGEGDSFYLGCLALWGVGSALRAELGIPIVDGAEASLKMAEVSVKLGLRHSRAAYPKYPLLHRKSSPAI
jgi:allantoin racemase